MRRIMLVVALLAVAAPPLARADAHGHPECKGTIDVRLWKRFPQGTVLENLAFARGSMFVSDQSAGAIHRIAPSGEMLSGGLTGVDAPGGIAQGPDGLLYAGTGNALAGAAARAGMATVIRWDPDAPQPAPETYASGFDMVNGMTFGPGGDLFVSNDVAVGLYRIPRGDPAHPVLLNDTWGTNGLVVGLDGRTLYSAITFDQRSPIEAHDLVTGAHHTAFRLTAGAVSLAPSVHPEHAEPDRPLLGIKGLDDLDRDPNGFLYVTANGTSELLRVDPWRGDACVLAVSLGNPSSVRVAPHGTPFADADPETVDLYTTSFSGNVVSVRYLPE